MSNLPHPRDMTLAQLEALPTVTRLFGPAAWEFVAANGTTWAAGLSGSSWVKCWRADPPPPAGPPAVARRA